MAVGEKAIMADAMEAVGQRVQEEATDELVSIERYDLRAAAIPIIPPAERDATVVHADQPIRVRTGSSDAVLEQRRRQPDLDHECIAVMAPRQRSPKLLFDHRFQKP